MSEDVLAPGVPVTQDEQPNVAQDTELTPETAFDATKDKSNLIDDFFRANEMHDRVEGESQVEPEPSADPSPVDNMGDRVNVEAPQETTAEEVPIDNDVKRYQYWQSEADKARNEKQELEARLQAVENQQAMQPQPEVESEPEVRFPDPPSKPSKPRNYSRADAMDDPESDSAKYLDEVDGWRDDMDEYNRLHQQYSQAIIEEERTKMKQEQDDILRAQAEKEAYTNNMTQMASHLKGNYQASDEEIATFVKVMDDPKNITVDNLFQLFRMQNGNQAPAPVTQTAPNESFEQRKRAQSVPSPMGVVPAQSTTQQSGSDTVMDSMINDYKTRNPFG